MSESDARARAPLLHQHPVWQGRLGLAPTPFARARAPLLHQRRPNRTQYASHRASRRFFSQTALEFLDLQIAEGDGRVAVVLKEDAPFRNLAPVLRLASGVNAPFRILRRLHRRLERRRAAVILENLDTIEPVLDMRTLRDDHAAVPLARALENLVGVGGNDVVKRRGLAVAVLALVGIGMTVLENLVLLARALVERLVVDARAYGTRSWGGFAA